MTSQPNFHDGFVDGLILFKSKVHIFLRTISGGKYTLILYEMEALRANDIREGNIILDVDFFESNQLDVSFIFEVYQYSDEHKKKFVVEDWIRAASQKRLKGIEISTSYGCTLLAIFKTHEFVEGYLTSPLPSEPPVNA